MPVLTLSPVTWALLVKPALTAGVFALAGVGTLWALWAAGRRDMRAGYTTRSLGVVVFAAACFVMAGFFAFIFSFYAITG